MSMSAEELGRREKRGSSLDSHASRKGISDSEITEALEAYFGLTGHVREYADSQARSDGNVGDEQMAALLLLSFRESQIHLS
jgi:hypothetical protein